MPMDKERLDLIESRLSAALFCDILDSMGYRHQAISGNLVPLRDDQKLAGIARTILAYDVSEVPDKPYEAEIEAVDSLRPGDIAVCSNPSSSSGFWGELLATAAIARGARGAIIDGAVRDICQLRRLEAFKVFAKGRNPLDSKGRCTVAAYDVPIRCDGVIVRPGDLLFGDIDGIAVIPQEIAEEAVERAFGKAAAESLVRKELEEGRLLSEVFAKYNIL